MSFASFRGFIFLKCNYPLKRVSIPEVASVYWRENLPPQTSPPRLSHTETRSHPKKDKKKNKERFKKS